ncbi:hypothetical protein Fmac_024766 [Flemingia macrophylla]|uniref:Uncharacterized protein n=1 Tax=Flemingia macrophylla TaxID=520843 RepID=A0ABD1LQA2_9FABA
MNTPILGTSLLYTKKTRDNKPRLDTLIIHRHKQISRSGQIIITSLIREGFSPPTIEETTNISGIEKNCLSIGA